jgi:transcriptional regulator with XRE-family HTH domain
LTANVHHYSILSSPKIAKSRIIFLAIYQKLVYGIIGRGGRYRLPAAKPDLKTINGRIQQARMNAGHDQAEFAELIGEKPDTWSKIERGGKNGTRVLYEHIEKANRILKLDVRYYFGEATYEQAKDPEKIILTKEIADRLRALEESQNPIKGLDEVTSAVKKRPDLRKIVSIFYDRSSSDLKEIKALLYGYYFESASLPKPQKSIINGNEEEKERHVGNE